MHMMHPPSPPPPGTYLPTMLYLLLLHLIPPQASSEICGLRTLYDGSSSGSGTPLFSSIMTIKYQYHTMILSKKCFFVAVAVTFSLLLLPLSLPRGDRDGRVKCDLFVTPPSPRAHTQDVHSSHQCFSFSCPLLAAPTVFFYLFLVRYSPVHQSPGVQ